MNRDTEKLKQIRSVVEEWANKQGHDRCWYYPDLFHQIAVILDVELPKTPVLPPRVEFEEGCRRYQNEEFGLQPD